MELSVRFNSYDDNHGWYIYNNNLNNSDAYIAKLLDIPFKEYKNLLIKYGAYLNNSAVSYYFESEEDANKFLESEEIELRRIMLKIIGN